MADRKRGEDIRVPLYDCFCDEAHGYWCELHDELCTDDEKRRRMLKAAAEHDR